MYAGYTVDTECVGTVDLLCIYVAQTTSLTRFAVSLHRLRVPESIHYEIAV